jgi:hypothetical protein
VAPKPCSGGYADSDDCNANYLPWALRKTLLFVPAFSKIVTGLAKTKFLLGGLIPDLAVSSFNRNTREHILVVPGDHAMSGSFSIRKVTLSASSRHPWRLSFGCPGNRGRRPDRQPGHPTVGAIVLMALLRLDKQHWPFCREIAQ